MKKLLFLLALGGLLLAFFIIPASSQVSPRGDPYGARALQSLEQAFTTTGVLTYPNYAAAPIACGATTRGVYYYDTTLTDARVCGAAGWASIFGALTVGTAATIPMWNAVPDDLVDSSLTDDGTDVVSTGGLFTAGTAVAAAESILIDGNNSLISFEGATVDTFEGIVQGTDFLGLSDVTLTLAGTAPAANGNVAELATTIAIMDGADTLNFLLANVTNNAHTGAANSNFLNGVISYLDGGTAATVEAAFNANGAWDYSLVDDNNLDFGSYSNIYTMGDLLDWSTVFTFDTAGAAGASHTWMLLNDTVPIMDDDDVIDGIRVQFTNTDHTGANNTLTGVNVWGVISDPQADERAISVGTGWDVGIWGDTTTLMMGSSLGVVSLLDSAYGVIVSFDLEHGAGEVNRWETIIATLAIMDGVGIDTATALDLQVTNANHTDAGAGVFVNGLNISDLGGGGDPDATETAINIGAGWDVGLSLSDGSATDDNISFGIGNDVQMYFNSLNFEIDLNSAIISFNTLMANNSQAIVDWTWTGTGNDIEFRGVNAANAGFNMIDVVIGAVAATNGNDIINMLLLDWNETDWATATETLNAILIDGITQDAQGDYFAVNIGDGWDGEIAYADGTTFYIRDDETGAGDTWLYMGDVNNGPGFIFSKASADTVVGINDEFAEFAWRTQAYNGNDTVHGVFLDPVSPSGTGASNYFYGFGADNIGGDVDLTEVIFYADETGWDHGLQVSGTAEDIDHGITASVLFDPTLEANDDASDQRNVLLIDVDVPNGSAGLVNAINVDAVTDDPNSIDSAIFIEGGWDSAITISDRGGVATSNALTGTVMIFLDDDADYAADANNDCALIARDGAGTNHVLAIIVNNGACP